MGEKTTMAQFILYISLVLTIVLAESPPVHDSYDGKSMPPACPKNEVRRCQYRCPPDTCFTLYAAIDCIRNQTCVDGCYCKEDYLRIGQKGPCVPRDQCNPFECVNDPNAQRGCGDKCGKSCADYNDKKKVCPKAPCKKDGCECKDGYVYDPNVNLCVKPKDCTKPCKPNERYSTCLISECGPKTCDDLGKALACPAIAADPCPGGCVCDYGYVKDKDGNCIDSKTCPSCGGDPNAQAGCGNPCGKTCASLNANKSDLVCPQYCEDNGCDCKEGYLLNTDVKPPKCVLVKDCPKPPNKCGKNEEFYCGPSCPDSEASCANPNAPICINKKCELKCFCKKGFVRDANNTCIPADKCPKKCNAPHERFSDCLLNECVPKTCDDLGKSISCPFLPPGACAGGCICERDYVRNSEGTCIKLEECPPKPCTGNLTWMSPCNDPCPEPRCPKDDQPPPPCIPVKPCYPGCQCKPNYLRDYPGHCILASDCPPVNCTRQNEVWNSCSSACLAESCDDVNNQPTKCNTTICSPRCVCKKGHFRNKDGLCVAASQCPKQCTKPHERYSSCLLGECVPKTCGDLGMPLPCPRVMPPCAGGCICEEGYVRDKKGNCIDAKTCPSCGGDPNAEAGCGNPCGRTCASLKTNSRKKRDTAAPACATFCLANGCDCKEGYILNTDLKPPRCVLPKDCNKPQNCTGANEQYTDCVQGQCRPTTCKDVNKMPICPTTTKPCSGGCICKTGFVRSDNGTCIAINDCPEAGSCSDPNQAWVQCAVNCANAYCPKDDQPQPICFLPAGVCFPGCKCKPNFRIDKNNKCIPARDCPAVPCTRYNEEYDSCPDRITSCALLGTTPVTNTGSKICNPACICKEGFYQNANGTCVPKCECSSDTDSSG